MNTRLAILLCLALASDNAAAVCSTGTQGRSQCAGPVKDLFVPTTGSTTLVRLQDTDDSVMTCTLNGGYWTLSTADANYQSYYQLLLVSAATGHSVEIVSRSNDSAGCDVDTIRLVSP